MIIAKTGTDKEKLLNHTGCIITTLGEHGSCVYASGSVTTIPPAKIKKAVDPTGAGDAYRSGLLKGLSMGLNFVQSAVMGSVSASYAVECLGTQEHRYTFEQFAARLKDNFEIIL